MDDTKRQGTASRQTYEVSTICYIFDKASVSLDGLGFFSTMQQAKLVSVRRMAHPFFEN